VAMRHTRNVDRKLVYEVVKLIPKGKVSSYGTIARAMGVPGAARAIGSIMRANPNPPAIPCHRVVYSDGRLGGFSGRSHIPKKARLLRSEGIRIVNGRIVDFSRVFHDFRG
jgi:O-6-methylguanine DNA methyltransferase